MTADHAALPAPKDNLLGVCAALGEDFGFNPIWLRIAFATALLFSLEGVIAAYATLGVVVLVSRLIAPNPRRRVADAPAQPPIVIEDTEFRQAA